MSDNATGTAPLSGGESSLIDAGARRLAALRVAPPSAAAPPSASPTEAPPTTAGDAESTPYQAEHGRQPLEPPPDLEPAADDQALVTDGTDGEAQPAALEPADPDPILYTHEDGTVVRKSEAPEHLMRWKDYSQKTELLARGRNIMTSVINDTIAAREVAVKLIEARLPQVNDALEHEDPGQWAAQIYRREAAIRQIARMRTDNFADQQRLAEADAVQAETDLPRALPQWQDRATELRDQDVARRYLASENYPPHALDVIRRNPWLIRLTLQAARHKPVVEGARKGGAASAAARAQPSPSIQQAAVRPAPPRSMANNRAATVKQRPGSLRSLVEQGASRLRPL